MKIILFAGKQEMCEAKLELNEFKSEIVMKRDYIKFMQINLLHQKSTKELFNLELFVSLIEK